MRKKIKSKKSVLTANQLLTKATTNFYELSLIEVKQLADLLSVKSIDVDDRRELDSWYGAISSVLARKNVNFADESQLTAYFQSLREGLG